MLTEDAERGAFTVGYCVHHFATAVDDVAASVEFRIARAAGFAIDRNQAAPRFDSLDT